MAVNMPFKPRARLLLQLGEQLIRSEDIAVLELIKNSYDADATKVSVTMNNIENSKVGIITIEDNGDGMDIDVIKNIWMEPGNDHKRRNIEHEIRSPLGRLPIGEKGIGRFGVHRIAKNIELISRMSGKKEVCLSIDWSIFNNDGYLDDVIIKINEREPEHFVGESKGTIITLKSLSVDWTRGMLRKVYRAVTTLNSPFESDSTFRISFVTSKQDWLLGLLTFRKITEFALYYTEIILTGNKIEKFLYEFRPYDNMSGLKKRVVNRKNERMVTKDNVDIDISKFKIGKVRIKMYVFDRTASLVSKFINDKRTFREYLDNNGGMSVFRDGMRVYNYGEPDNDWLGFDLQRVNRPSANLSNNLILGAVFLNRNESSDLMEKSNREGFIENEAYNVFKEAVSYAIDRFVTYRNIDKVNLRTSLSGGVNEPITKNVSEIREKLKKYIPDINNRKEIDGYLKRVEEDYDYIKMMYLKTASAGMAYGVVVHEIEKIISELNRTVMLEGASNKLKSLAKHLSRLVENYAELLRNKTKENIEAKNIIGQALFSIQYRLEAHKIKIIDRYSDYKNNQNIRCSYNLIVGSIINVIDNAIWWTTYAKVRDKKILVKLTKEIDGFVSIVIADNGCGFSLSPEDMIKPFVGTKPGGMGIGLNIVNEIMLSQGGKLEFPENGDIEVGTEFNTGAIVALCFKENAK